MAIKRIQTFLMSLLTRQLALAKDGFLTRYPNCWLVWEPGSVLVSGVDVSTTTTQMPGGAAREARPLGGDGLCFALKVPEGASLKLGRAAENELVVSDMTVSRLHARFDLSSGVWSLTPLSETKRTTLAGKEVPGHTSIALQSGQVLEFGEVKVTYYDANAFKNRIETASLKPKG